MSVEHFWNGQVLEGDLLGMDTETELIPEDGSIPTMALISVCNGQEGFVVPYWRAVQFISMHIDASWVFHNVGFDFWANEFIKPIQGQLQRTIAPASCQVLAVRQAADQFWVIQKTVQH